MTFIPDLGYDQPCAQCGEDIDHRPIYVLPCGHGSAYDHPMHIGCQAESFDEQRTVAAAAGVAPAAFQPRCPIGGCGQTLDAAQRTSWLGALAAVMNGLDDNGVAMLNFMLLGGDDETNPIAPNRGAPGQASPADEGQLADPDTAVTSGVEPENAGGDDPDREDRPSGDGRLDQPELDRENEEEEAEDEAEQEAEQDAEEENDDDG